MEKNKGLSNTVAQKRPRHSPKKGVDECKGCDSKLQDDDFALLCDSCESWFSVVVDSLVDSVSDCLLVDVKLPYHSNYMCIAAFYRSPTVNLSSPVNNANILACISRLVGRSSKFLILGDFNLPLIDWSAHRTSLSTSSYEQQFLDRLDDLCLYQHIVRATRARNDAIPSILDLVITKSIDDILSVDFSPPLGKSDHVVLDIYMNIDAQQRGFKFYRHDYAKADYESMRQFISSLNIILWRSYIESRHSKVVRQGHLDTQLQEDSGEWHAYSLARNKVTRLLRANREELESRIIHSSTVSPKIFWKYVNRNKPNHALSISTFTHPDTHQKINSDSEKALIFNKIFSSVFVKTQPTHSNEANFASQVESIASPDILVLFDDSGFSLTEVYTILIKLDTSKAPDIDSFPNIMIRQIAHEIAEPLTYIFNLSLAHGLCPSGWKKALVKPLHKSGSRSDFKNYRPISITSIFCRVMEKLIVSRVQKYFDGNHLWNPAQHGFRKKIGLVILSFLRLLWIFNVLPI
ncbi:uncharacterized protein LOC136028527 [Artemia franciscana]|uniref:uncharacterized protein LOC136028527 n=1 Tax=Artemia franciscana TaxID=6661 RepID=UPI0032DBA0C9